MSRVMVAALAILLGLAATMTDTAAATARFFEVKTVVAYGQ